MDRSASPPSPELCFFLLASGALSALALVSLVGSFLVEYVSFLGRLDAIAFWTPLVVLGLASGGHWVALRWPSTRGAESGSRP